MTEPIKIGWKKLSTILNDVIIKNLNLQKPLKGDGISLSQTASGTIISRIKQGDDTSGGNNAATGGGGDGPQGGQWCTLEVIDTSSGVCVTKTLTYWGTPPS